MIHIVLLILKMIGMILAIVVGIVLVLLGIVLFVPIRYRVDGEIDNAVKKRDIEIRFYWFFHLLSGYANYKDNEFSWKVRFFWKRWELDDDVETSVSSKAEQNETMTETESESEKETKTESASKKEAKKKSKQKQEKRKKKYTFQKICDKIKSFIEKKNELQEFIGDTKHRRAFAIVKREVFRLHKVLKPRTVQMQVHFGFEDPYMTGNVLAVLSMLYPWYGDSVEIEPDFEEQVLEGNLHMKGKLHLIWLVVMIWNLYFNDCVMDTYRELKKLGGNE